MGYNQAKSVAKLQTLRNNEAQQRHQRATQLADAIDLFTFQEALHRAIMPFEYVHRAESQRLEREEEADKICA